METRYEAACRQCGHICPVVPDRADERLFYFECPVCGLSERLTVKDEEPANG